MSETVIRVEGLSKRYRLGMLHQRTNSFRDGLTSFLKRYSKRKEVGIVWALKEVSFEVKEGEILGIIGPNGAGKSTLLKILSRITKPTSGEALIDGRVGSLLEVGTGFHPELTGRENIYLNGAILGMSKAEIKRKFDEIVAFAEVEKFLDTPVKRYSSGMYVRLAFAVAAHLDLEILLVDEVLAVGDASFQKKCLGKIRDVTKRGRTILLVSHNMASVASICDTVIWIDHGHVKVKGEPQRVVQEYLSDGSTYRPTLQFDEDPSKIAQIFKIELVDSNGDFSTSFNATLPIQIRVTYRIKAPIGNYRVGIVVSRNDGLEVFVSNSNDWAEAIDVTDVGEYISTLHIPAPFLIEGHYIISVYLGEPGKITHDVYKDIMRFDVCGNLFKIQEKRRGLLSYPFKWDFQSV